jgi:tRNA(Ile)-lysidine synthase
VTPEQLRADPLVAGLLERCTFPPAADPSDPVHCAVSGGADSSALLVLARAAGAAVVAVHVDHGLRPGSADEAASVRALAERFGAGFEARSAPVAAGGDLEARARAARHGALPPDAWFGHTADDQAETVVLRLLRGTGPNGLAAMRAERHPLLGLRRAQTRALCAHLDITTVEDPSNGDPRFTRNRVRHQVVPLLDSVAERDVTPLLCRLAELCAAQADLLGELAAGEDPADAARLAALPSPVAAEVIRRWWSDATGLDHPPDAAATGRILEVAAGRSVGCEVASGWRVRRSGGRLTLRHHGPT